MTSIALFSSIAFITIVVPGPTTLLALRHGASGGVRTALPGIAGAILSDLLMIAAVAAGLGSVLAGSAQVLEVIRWLGVTYLVILGARMLLQLGAESLVDPKPTNNGLSAAGHSMRRAFLVAVTNPKGYLFFAALLPSFIDTGAPLAVQYAVLTVIFTALDAAVLLVYAMVGGYGIALLPVRASQRRIDQVSGITLLVMATTLAVWRKGAATAS